MKINRLEVENLTLKDIDFIEKNFTLIPINIQNWEEYYNFSSPKINAYIAYSANAITLLFKGEYAEFAATYKEDNSQTHEETCVEFFVSFDERHTYYNFEFNALTACRSSYGKRRPERELRSKTELAIIKRDTFYFSKDGRICWNLLVTIPNLIFSPNNINTFEGKTMYFNLCSCFDKANKLYYLTAFPIKTPKPSYHEPTYFEKCDLS